MTQEFVTLPREVVEHVLKAMGCGGLLKQRQAMAALHAALEQPQVEQEPVGEVGSMPGTTGFTMACFHVSDAPVGTKLYTRQQPHRQPLTAGDISLLWKRHTNVDGPHFNPYEDDGLEFARAIEAAHNIK